MKYKYSDVVFVFAWLLLFYSNCGKTDSSTGNQTNKIQCIAKEREALLQFKNGVQLYPCVLLDSWTGQECCQWHGIRCSNHSGYVISLELSGALYYYTHINLYLLQGTLSPSLVELKHLEYLDLSYNSFQAQPIPSFIGTLLNLKYLNLSQSNFVGEVPPELANLSSLTSLDLSNSFDDIYVKSLKWLSNLTLLTDINLSYANLSLATDWMQSINKLPMLRSLQMVECSLSEQISSSLLYTNSSTTLHHLSLSKNWLHDTRILQWVSNVTRLSSSFSHLDLSQNAFSDPIPSAFGSMQSLSYLDLSGNIFEGPIPETFLHLKHLVHLDLSSNNIQGSKWNPEVLRNFCVLEMLSLNGNNITNELSSIIQPLSQCAHSSLVSLNIHDNHLWGSLSDEIGTFSALYELNLDVNQLNGTISPSLGELSLLERLDLSSNSLKGTISNHYLSNLSRLIVLDLSDNELVINISANWVPPFQLDVIHLRSCKLGPYFPKWLLTQTNFSSLDISNAKISDKIPTLFWELLTSNLEYMNMSINMINGSIPDILISFKNSPQIDLSSNSFHGRIPSFLINASILILNDNKFSDLAPFFCPKSEVFLSTLRLTNNKLSGELPSCWGYFDQLTSLYLDNNNFSGKLPESIGMMAQLEALHLRNNSISGKLPMPLQNLTSLLILDISYNSVTGHIPHLIGHHFASLVVLNLRNNNFLGKVPLSLCQLSGLKILDFSSNQLSGFIPKCIWNLTAMSLPDDGRSNPRIDIIYSEFPMESATFFSSYVDSAQIMWRGKEWSLTNLREVKVIDMSNNELEGPIPDGISRLVGLISLDLSKNRLNGNITQNIGRLTSLEYLNLSRNLLCGEIPGSLSTVSTLEILDVSYNNLSGRIPHGTQLQGFNPSSYIGNPRLCGEPLLNCPGDPTPTNSPKEDKSSHQDNHHDDDDDNLFPGLYISVVLGFIVGFWGVCGTLVIKISWRNAFFQFFDDIKDKLHMLAVVNKARVLRRNT